MAKIRLDKVNDKKVISVKAHKALEDGAFVAIKTVIGEASLEREVYLAQDLVGGEAKGRIAMVAMDVHRYEDLGYRDDRVKEYGWDKKCKENDIVRAYILDAGDIISTNDAELVAMNAGDLLKAGAGKLVKTETDADAVAMVIAKEKWCGVDVAVIQFL